MPPLGVRGRRRPRGLDSIPVRGAWYEPSAFRLQSSFSCGGKVVAFEKSGEPKLSNRHVATSKRFSLPAIRAILTTTHITTIYLTREYLLRIPEGLYWREKAEKKNQQLDYRKPGTAPSNNRPYRTQPTRQHI